MWPNQDKDVLERFPLEFIVNSGKGLNKNNLLLDIHNFRLKNMDKNNIKIQIISPTAVGAQSLKNHSIEYQNKKCVEINNYMHEQMHKNPKRFRGFCTLPMKSPILAAKELKRCIKELKMVGALINGSDYIYTKDDFATEAIFYDTKDYDILWKTFQELDVPLYIHPSFYHTPQGTIPSFNILELYDLYPNMSGSSWGFYHYLAQHILRLLLSGIFDRFPKMKLILGHMGEMLPWFAERFDHRICIYKSENKQVSKHQKKKYNLANFVLPQRPLVYYLKHNIYVTTSGWFSDSALKYVIEKIGVDRVLFAIDYPYEEQKIASDWLNKIDISKQDKEKIAYKNALKLLKIKI
jgi:predicted TIM-barrel fold metal-dependent hydrolase